MTKQPHIIHRQVFDLTLPEQRGAYELQTAISLQYQQQVLPKLAEWLDRTIPESQVIRLDKLEVDLGTVTLADFENQLFSKLKELFGAIHQQQEQAEESPQFQTIETKWVQAFLYFLEHGRLPWWVNLSQGENLEAKLQEYLPAIAASVVGMIRKTIKKGIAEWLNKAQVFSSATWQTAAEGFISQMDAVLLKRLVEQSSDAFLDELLKQGYLLSEVEFQAIQQLAQASLRQDARDVSRPKRRLMFWITVIATIENQDFSAQLKSHSLIAGEQSNTKEQKEFRKVSSKAENKISEPTNGKLSNLAIDKTFPEKQSSAVEEGYHIQNAGLVLLSPYLGDFFKALGLVEQRAFVNEEAQQRAIHLTEFLATGELYPPEYHLILNKILCGWSLEETLPRKINLLESEQQEATQLLEAVIQNWSVLKNTSVAGLRETFLQRQGKLTFQNNNTWLLQVEHKPFDILLSQLPWGYAMIKHSWMPHLLRVEWA